MFVFPKSSSQNILLVLYHLLIFGIKGAPELVLRIQGVNRVLKISPNFVSHSLIPSGSIVG